MFAEFKHTLRRLRGQIIGWGAGLLLYGLFMASFYSNVEDIGARFQELLDSYPPELLAFFMSGGLDITSPAGYLETYYFSYMTLIVGIFAVGACANLLSGDEEKGILDLLMAYPVSRTAFFFGRVLGFVAATVAILLVGWLGWVIPSASSGLDLAWYELLRPFGPLLGVLLVFGALALLFSMFLPAARLAGGLAGALLVANFLLIGLSSLNPDIEPVFKVTPFYYYQGGAAIAGLDWGWLAGLLAASVVLALVAWLRFLRRDIRVGGERSWRLPLVPARLQGR